MSVNKDTMKISSLDTKSHTTSSAQLDTPWVQLKVHQPIAIQRKIQLKQKRCNRLSDVTSCKRACSSPPPSKASWPQPVTCEDVLQIWFYQEWIQCIALTQHLSPGWKWPGEGRQTGETWKSHRLPYFHIKWTWGSFFQLICLESRKSARSFWRLVKEKVFQISYFHNKTNLAEKNHSWMKILSTANSMWAYGSILELTSQSPSLRSYDMIKVARQDLSK